MQTKTAHPYTDQYCTVVPIFPQGKTDTVRAITVLQYIRKSMPINHIFPLRMGKPATNKQLELVFRKTFVFYFYSGPQEYIFK